MVPWAVYVTLTPFLGGEEAYAVATGGGARAPIGDRLVAAR